MCWLVGWRVIEMTPVDLGEMERAVEVINSLKRWTEWMDWVRRRKSGQGGMHSIY